MSIKCRCILRGRDTNLNKVKMYELEDCLEFQTVFFCVIKIFIFYPTSNKNPLIIVTNSSRFPI